MKASDIPGAALAVAWFSALLLVCSASMSDRTTDHGGAAKVILPPVRPAPVLKWREPVSNPYKLDVPEVPFEKGSQP